MTITTQRDSIPVRTATAHYTVEIGPNLLPGIGQRLDTLLHGTLSTGKRRSFLITSPEIAQLWAEPLLAGFPNRPEVLQITAGEAHKRLPTVERLAEELAQHGADRDSVLIALGGGVLGDLTGFLAAIYMRGIPYIQVPTTALAMVDSAVGGKTGANLAAGKNLIGAFHHPLAVYADIATLSTLPAQELRAGLQEAIKSAIIRDAELFDFLEREQAAVLNGNPEALQHVVAACVRIKAEIVEADEREGNLRMILNLGHTLGHAIEAATHYTALLHGEAIAWGMLAALHIAQGRGTVTPTQANRMSELISTYGPLKLFTADPDQLVALTAKDKKNRSGTRSFVLPVGIGDATVLRDVTDEELLEAANLITRTQASSGTETQIEHRAIIPPRSVVRVKKRDADMVPTFKIGNTFRIGYYSKQDGLDCVWLVNAEAKYEQTWDQKSLPTYFEVVSLSEETDLYGVNSPELEPLS